MDTPKTSETLLDSIAGSPQSGRWQDFYTRYRPVMEGFLQTAFPSLEAEDVIQDVMLALMAKLPGYRYEPDSKGHFRNYLIGIVKFKAIEQLKRRRRDADRVAEYMADRMSHEPAADSRVAEDELHMWRHHAYEAALAQLMADKTIRERSRCVFVRVALDHESPESVAAAYGITRNSVDQIKNRMIAKLRKLIAQMTERDSDGLR